MAWLESQKKQGRIPRYDDPEVSIHDEKELGSKKRLLEPDSSSQKPAKLEQSSQQSPPSQPPASIFPKYTSPAGRIVNLHNLLKNCVVLDTLQDSLFWVAGISIAFMTLSRRRSGYQ